LGGVGVLRTLGVGVGVELKNSTPNHEVQFNHFLHRTPKLGEMAQFLLKLLLKQIIFAVHHDFH